MSAVAELQAVGFPEAMSVERLLQDPRSQSGLKDSVIIVDEAGMVSGRQMAAAARPGATERRAYRLYRRHSPDPECRGRRCTASARDGIALEIGDASRGPASNGSRLPGSNRGIAPGSGEWISTSSKPSALFEKSAGTIARPPLQKRGIEPREPKSRSVLVVCATHDEIARVTDAIRERRKEAGLLGDAHSVARDVALGWTTAQKSDWRNYRPGQMLSFHRAVKGHRAERNAGGGPRRDRGMVVGAATAANGQ